MHRKYTWVGNQISPDDMRKLYQIKQVEKVAITKLVALAVKEFIKNQEKIGGEK